MARRSVPACAIALCATWAIVQWEAGCASRRQERADSSDDHADTPQRSTPWELSPWRIKDEGEAIQWGAAVVGGASDLPSASAEVITISEDAVPFLYEELRGAQVWRVVLPGTKFDLGDGRTTRAFEVVCQFRRENGALISITTMWPEELAPVWPFPPGPIATERIKAGGDEVWHGLLKARPERSLAQVLRCIQSEFGGVSAAKQIVAHCLMWSRLGHPQPRATWSVDLRGLPEEPYAIRTDDSGKPIRLQENFVNHLRHCVTDNDCDWLTAGTRPQPVPPDAQKPNIPEDKQPSSK